MPVLLFSFVTVCYVQNINRAEQLYVGRKSEVELSSGRRRPSMVRLVNCLLTTSTLLFPIFHGILFSLFPLSTQIQMGKEISKSYLFSSHPYLFFSKKTNKQQQLRFLSCTQKLPLLAFALTSFRLRMTAELYSNFRQAYMPPVLKRNNSLNN